MSDINHPSPVPPAEEKQENHLAEVALLFLRLGFTAFGGPAAHIAMMREEVVRRRKWISDERFVDLLGITNLIPGPSSTEFAIYLGYLRAGWPGLVIGGICFIGPAMLIVLTLAWAYVSYGSLPQVEWLFYGIKPIVIAIIAQVLVSLCRTVLKGAWSVMLGLLVLALYLPGTNTIALLFGGALLFGIIRWVERSYQRRHKSGSEISNVLMALPLASIQELRQYISLTRISAGLAAVATVAVPYSLPLLFLTFLKIGAVLYGSGYVILAFLRPEFVVNLHWLTDRQLLDAVAIGQFTPGPVSTTATFIGFLVGGVPGALAATVAIFLPAFVYVVLVYPNVARLRRTPWTRAFLDGVNVAALGLMAGVTWDLARAAIVDPLTVVLALIAAALLIRWKVNSAWLVLGGGVVGVIAHLIAL